MPTSAAVYDCKGPSLTSNERDFFRDADPWGFILFARHCETSQQMLKLCAELRESVGRETPILIDQEGGRVARMRSRDGKNPEWRDHPPMAVFGDLWRLDPGKAQEAAWLNGYLLGDMVRTCGVNVNCAPMLDVRQLDSDPVTIGDRAIAMHSDIVAPIGAAIMAGLQVGGSLPIIKHMPGLGRASCDSHYELPIVPAKHSDLAGSDFVPFKYLSDLSHSAPMGMTGHVVYPDLDPENCVTHSTIIIQEIIRGEIGFKGLLFSDDLKMEALGGHYRGRAEKALKAGCDIALACNFSLKEKQEIAQGVGALTPEASLRAEAALNWKSTMQAPEVERSYRALQELLKPVWPLMA